MSSAKLFFRRSAVRIIVLLLLQQTGAQQYTGVKLVSPATEDKVVPENSARSFNGGVPTADSNIIKLSIKSPASGQGFATAKGRNLGFKNDPSLNAIPAGINNELSNVDVRRLTTVPNTVLRDSYGNPVTPFPDLDNPVRGSIGFPTSVKLESGFSSPNIRQAGQFNFKVPSYASGIIEPIGQPNFGLLAPNPPESTVIPSSSTSIGGPSATQQQFLPNAKIPTIAEGPILFAQKPVNGLLPPLFPDQMPAVFDVKVGTERSPFFVRDPFSELAAKPSLEVGFKTDVNKQTSNAPVSNVNQNRVSGSFEESHTTKQSQQPVINSAGTQTIPPVQKYTGSFGGPTGFLGSQQNIGTAYTSTSKPSLQAAVPIAHPSMSAVFVPQNTFTTTARPLEQTTVVQKYSGSFGGPSGLLGSQQNLGTAYKNPMPTIAVTGSRPVHFQQTSSASLSPSVPVFTPQISPPQTVHVPVVNPTQEPNRFIGSLGFGSAIQGPINVPNLPAPAFSQHPTRPASSPTFNGGNKFTGSFGGAPGLLGSQPIPGTHVKPDGSILPPSAPVVGFATTQQQQLQTGGAGSKFTGSFGGPPGVLRPFDNTNG